MIESIDNISAVRRDDEGRWVWTVTATYWTPDGSEVRTSTWRTDSRGQGLWLVSETGRPDRQIKGHMQFDLNASASTRRRRVVAVAQAL